MLNVLDEFARESLGRRVRRKLSSTDVIDVLPTCSPAGIPPMSGPTTARSSSPRPSAGSLQWEPGPPSSSPARPGRTDTSRANARLRDELPNGSSAGSPGSHRILAASLQCHPPSQRLGYRPSAPETIVTKLAARLSAPPNAQLGGGIVNALTDRNSGVETVDPLEGRTERRTEGTGAGCQAEIRDAGCAGRVMPTILRPGVARQDARPSAVGKWTSTIGGAAAGRPVYPLLR